MSYSPHRGPLWATYDTQPAYSHFLRQCGVAFQVALPRVCHPPARFPQGLPGPPRDHSPLNDCAHQDRNDKVVNKSWSRNTMATITNPLAGRQRRHRGRMEDLGYTNRRLFGDYLADRRTARGLTQLELGKALGMTDTAVSAIELGRNSLSPERFTQTADALGIGRKQFARVVLRFYNPWLFSMLYPDQMPESVVEQLPTRRRDHRLEDTGNGDETDE